MLIAHSKVWYLQHFRMLDALSDTQKQYVHRVTRMLEATLAFLYPGDLFGELAICDDSPRDHVATAHEHSVLCAIDREMLVQLVQEVPSLGYQITKLMGFRLRRFRSRVEELLCKGATERIAHTLLNLASECGVRDSNGVLIKLHLNQVDLGNLVGLARETVNIVLQDFRQRGLIEMQGRQIRIADEQGLRKAM